MMSPGSRLIYPTSPDSDSLSSRTADWAGPNPGNLTEELRPCCLCGVPVLVVAGLVLCSWVGVPGGAFPSRGRFCDIPADLRGIGGQAETAHDVEYGRGQMLP